MLCCQGKLGEFSEDSFQNLFVTYYKYCVNWNVFYRISRSKVEVMLGINEEKLEVYPKDGYESSVATSSSGTGRIGMSFTVAS